MCVSIVGGPFGIHGSLGFLLEVQQPQFTITGLIELNLLLKPVVFPN